MAEYFVPDINKEYDDAVERLDRARASGLVSDVSDRFAYLGRTQQVWSRDLRLIRPAIFVSFSGESGAQLHKHALTVLRGTKASRLGPQFRTESGMRKEGHPNVIEHVLSHIDPCFGFLGIFTCEVPVASGRGGVPGPWVQFELGLAVARGLRCVLMIEEGIDEVVWRKPFGHFRHVFFTPAMFKAKLQDAAKIFQEHYAIAMDDSQRW